MGWNDFGSVQLSDIQQTEFLMHTADRFQKFATECQVMAQLAPETEGAGSAPARDAGP
jgi:hypothetical protein